MKLSKKSGATIAAAAAAFVMSGAVFAPAAFATDEKIHCHGINSCKGTSACKTAMNECKGKNACKGHGFVSLTKADCTTQGGSLTEAAPVAPVAPAAPAPVDKKS